MNPEIMEKIAENRFKAIDTNKDESISLEEFLAEQKALFARLDVNKDGKVTADEHKKVFQRGPRGDRPEKPEGATAKTGPPEGKGKGKGEGRGGSRGGRGPKR